MTAPGVRIFRLTRHRHARTGLTVPAAFLFPVCVALAAALLPGCGDDGIPTLRVPEDYPHPQAAVDAAKRGEIVAIQAGTYTRTEVRDVDPEGHPGGIRAALFLKEGVEVLGRGDPGGVVFRDTTAADSTVGAVLAFVSNDTFIDNLVFEDFGTGVLIRGGDGAVVNSIVRGGQTGIHTQDAVLPFIRFNLVEEAGGAGIHDEKSAGDYQFNIVRRNDVGMNIDADGRPVVKNNIFCRNGVGIAASGGANPVLSFNVTRNNQRAGLQLGDDAVPSLIQNDLYNNPIDLEITGYAPPLADPLDATKHYWGIIDPEEVGATRIRDAEDDPALGATVNFLPITPGPWFSVQVNLDSICRSDALSLAATVMPRFRAYAGDRPGQRKGQ